MQIIHILVSGTTVKGFDADSRFSEPTHGLYLSNENLATDPDDRDITAALCQFNLTSSITPTEWPHRDTAIVQLQSASFYGRGGSY